MERAVNGHRLGNRINRLKWAFANNVITTIDQSNEFLLFGPIYRSSIIIYQLVQSGRAGTGEVDSRFGVYWNDLYEIVLSLLIDLREIVPFSID